MVPQLSEIPEGTNNPVYFSSDPVKLNHLHPAIISYILTVRGSGFELEILVMSSVN